MANPIVVDVVKMVGPQCVATDDALVLHDQIAALLKEGKDVTLAFDKAETIISAFLNAAIGKLYGEFKEADIDSHLRVTGLPDAGLLERIKTNAKRYFRNQKAYNAAWVENGR